MERRSYLAAVGAVTAAGFAGCVGELGAGDDDGETAGTATWRIATTKPVNETTSTMR